MDNLRNLYLKDDIKRLYLNKIKHDIRNCKRLTEEQIEVINLSSDKDKMEIILLYSIVVYQWNQIINEL